MRRPSFPFLAATVLIASLFATESLAAVFSPEAFTLANGLRVVVVTNTLSDAIVQMVWFKSGAADDLPGKTGTAHYLEHLMFKGTKNVPDGAFSALVAARGGQDNAFTTQDTTAYHITLSRENLPIAMQLEADRMGALFINDASAQVELNVVRSERQERTDNKPLGLFEEKMRAALFPDHPYGRPVIGAAEDLRVLTPDDARIFYRANYAPENAILILSGNITAKEALPLAAATFGRLQCKGNEKKSLLPSGKPPREKEVSLADARVKQPLWVKRYVVPSLHEKRKDSVALEVLAEVLTGGEVGILYRQLVVKSGVASGIDVSYDPIARGPAVFAFSGTPAPGIDIAVVEEETEKYLARLSHHGIAAKEIAMAKQRMLDAAVFARDRIMAPAQLLGEALAVGGSVYDVEGWPESISSVTASDVNRVLRNVVHSTKFVRGRLLPAAVRGGTP